MRILLTLLMVSALAGCKQMPDVPTIVSPYKIDIQQGNVVTQEMLAKLKAGMTRSQVRFALGSPLVIDPFRTDRWDYVYSYQKQGKAAERRRVTVIFDEDKLARIEGDVVPVDSAQDKPVDYSPAAATPVIKPAAADKPTVSKPAPAKLTEKSVAKPPVAAVPAAAASDKAEAPKSVIAKPVGKPVEQPPVAAVPAAAASDKPAATTPDAAKPDAAAGTAAAGSAPPEAAKPDSAKPDAKAAPAEAKRTDTAQSGSSKERPRGLFGRMLDKIGF